MAAARLYPTLGSFYKNTYIDFGSEADMLKCVAEEKLYRKPLNDDNRANNMTGQEQEKKVQTKDIKQKKKMKLNNLEAGQEQSPEHRADESLEEISRLISLNQHSDRVPDVPCLPSAPPLEWSDDAIQRFLNDALAQQELTQDAPTIDYSTLAMPADIPFDEAWIDDLVPDYDTTADDENDSENFNNLNKEQTKALRKKSLLIKNIIEIRESPSAQRRGRSQSPSVTISTNIIAATSTTEPPIRRKLRLK
ncbi:unnamed protein product [Lymnaea stagnalis]|uniref:Uncharacterized protein n=1 Tax=Lymnaea stagnalis TaxID=6523 RepID=A0AAV2IL65_LYMST